MRQSLRLIIAIALLGSAARAQIGRATILGSVMDGSDSPVSGAAIRITRLDTNTVYNTTTNETGLYRMPDLPVGPYSVTVTASGFKQSMRSGIVLEVDDKPEINFRLELGAVTETVVVAGQAPLVDTDSATVGKVIENTRMTNLPVSGRTVLSLVLLTPNVRGYTTNSPGFADRGAAVSNFSVNGSPASTSSLVIDGTTNNTPRNGDTGVSPTVDAIQEFKVQSGLMSAEYGYTLGGVINLVTRSGTNALHGTLYEFLRNKDLNARNTFSAVPPPLVYNQYGGSIGGPIRKNRAFFFFNYEEWRLSQSYTVIDSTPTVPERSGDFSRLLSSTGQLVPIYDPATIRPNPNGSGSITDPFPGNSITAVRLDPVALNVLPFYPLPNRPPTNTFTNVNNFQANLGTHRRAREETVKLDDTLTARDNISFHYILWDHRDDNASNGMTMFPDILARARYDDYSNRNVSLTEVHSLSPTAINEFHAGMPRQHFACDGASFNQGWPQKLGLPAAFPSLFLPTMAVQGFQQFPAGISTYDCLLSIYALQLADNFTWIQGKHSVKFGLDLRKDFFGRSQSNLRSGTFSFNSTLTGNLQQPAGTGFGLASFMLGAVANATVETDQPVSYYGYSQGYYAQDDWKVTRRLTLNLGVRWDYQGSPRETHNRISNFNPYVTNPKNGTRGALQFAGLDFGSSLVLPSYDNFAPRVGLALDPFGDGRTSIRAGYGIYYPLTFTSIYFPETTPGMNANITSYVGAGGSTLVPAFQLKNGFPYTPPLPLGSALGPGGLEGQAVSVVPPNGRTPYSQQWTLTVQRQLPGGLLLETGYSGNKGARLPTANYDLNQLPPQYYSMGQALLQSVPNPYAGKVTGAYSGATIVQQQLLRPYPYYGNINVTDPRAGSATYHSFLASVEKRMSNGLVLLGSFTFGKLINEGTSAISSSQANGDQLNLGNGYRLGEFNRRLERSLDPTDSAKRFVFSAVYELPFGAGKRWRSSSRVLNGVIGGWQFNNVTAMQDGLPLVIRGANNFIADRPNSTGANASLSNPGIAEWFNTAAFVNPPPFAIGNLARTLPNVRGPGIISVDLSVFKSTIFHERWNIQFRAEAFNVINHVNLLEPNATFVPGTNGQNSSGSFGVITNARDPRLMQLGLKFLF